HSDLLQQLKSGDRRALTESINDHFDIADDDMSADGHGHRHDGGAARAI
ncbi:MAG: hypothetical protein HOV83_36730, partial [Catenulispora sp.]|nr:hypothetical protein [Catenulispora sp.]